MYAYIAKSKANEAWVEEKRKRYEEAARTSKRATRSSTKKEEVPKSLPEVNMEDAPKDKKQGKPRGHSYKLKSDIELTTNLKKVFEERILNSKVEMTLGDILGMAKRKFHEEIIDIIKRKWQIPSDQEPKGVKSQVLQSGELMPGVTTVEIASRRKKLMSALPHGSLVILIAATVKHMTDVVPYPFRQSSHYLYFTGCREPGSIAVIYNAGDLCMFMPDPNPENALWEGRLAHAAEAMTNLEANRAYNMSDLPKFLPRLLKQAKAIYAEDENCPGDDLGKLPAYKELVQEKKVLSVHKYAYECRFVKSPSEISLMRRAAKITSEAFIQTMKVSRTRAHEHILAATMDFECKFRGAQRLA
ncbi:hypothetical protein L7F22_053091 [Adiantum nelumboides]|nr:hypothetical protein [Adiantum nelumboides]